MDHGESSDDVDGSGAFSKKNGRMKLTMDRHTVGAGGRLTGVQYSLYLHVTLVKFF